MINWTLQLRKAGSTGTDTLFVHVCERTDLTSDILSNDNRMASHEEDGKAANGFGDVFTKRLMFLTALSFLVPLLMDLYQKRPKPRNLLVNILLLN